MATPTVLLSALRRITQVPAGACLNGAEKATKAFVKLAPVPEGVGHIHTHLSSGHRFFPALLRLILSTPTTKANCFMVLRSH
jgi:hypothetical protein